jgi:hypothetical protein
MRVGTALHHLALGARTDVRVVRYEGEARRGKGWEAFEAEHAGPDVDIITAPEWREAEVLADVLRRDPIAWPLIDGPGTRKEVPLRWTDGGIECATSGVDVINDAEGYILDVKTIRSAEPKRAMRIATEMAYHAQLAFYLRGCAALNIGPIHTTYLACVETSPPFPVTVLRLTAPTITAGHKSLVLWLERLRQCEAEDHWPGYAQRPVDYELPAWMLPEEDEEADA